jgi:uncharacterized membrane protein
VSLVYRLGAFFFYFGLVCAILSSVVIAVLLALGAYGVPVSGILVSFSTLFVFELVLGTIIAILAGTRISSALRDIPLIGAFIPQISGSISTWMFLATFLPVYSPLATVVTYVVMLIPLPIPVQVGLAGSLHVLVAFTLVYYIASKVGAVPVI